MPEDGAENNAQITRGRPFEPGNPYRIQPGEVRNPGGRPKKKPITEIYEQILADEGNVDKIKKAVEAMLFSGRMAAQLQLKEMAERVEGKVTQPMQVDGELQVTLAGAIESARKRALQK